MGSLFKSKTETGSTLTNGQKSVAESIAQMLYWGQMKPGATNPDVPANRTGQSLLEAPITPYGGQLTAPLVPGYDAVSRLLQSYSPRAFDSGVSMSINSLLSGKPSYNLNPQITTDYFQQAVVNPAMRAYQKDIAPKIEEAFAGMGMLGSAQAQAKTNALTDMQLGFQSSLASLLQQNQGLEASLAESAANRQVQGVGLAQAVANQPLTSALMYEQALQPFQQRADMATQAQYQEWLRTQPYNNPWLQLGLGLTGQQHQFGVQQPSMLSQLAGLGSTIGLMGMGFGWNK